MRKGSRYGVCEEGRSGGGAHVDAGGVCVRPWAILTEMPTDLESVAQFHPLPSAFCLSCSAVCRTVRPVLPSPPHISMCSADHTLSPSHAVLAMGRLMP